MKVRTTKVQPTDTRGERIRARTRIDPIAVQTLTVAWDYGLSEMANHALAAKLLAHKVSGYGPSLLPTQVGTHQRGYDWDVASL